MDPEEKRRLLEVSIIRIIKDHLEKGSMDAERASGIAKLVLKVLPPHISLDEFYQVKLNPKMSVQEIERTTRLRTAFTPIVLTLLERELISPDADADPTTLLKTLIEQGPKKGVQLEQELTAQLRDFLGKEINWPEETLNISLSGKSHPLTKLNQAITGQFSDNAKVELMRLSI